MTGNKWAYDIEIIIEEAEGNYSAYSPDYPGCVATGDTVEETKANLFSAISLQARAGI